MPRTGAITGGDREKRRRSFHWRMRSISEEGRDNITRPERGPLGTGSSARRLCIARSGGKHAWARGATKGEINKDAGRKDGGIGLNPGRVIGRFRSELSGCLCLKPYRGKTRCTEF